MYHVVVDGLQYDDIYSRMFSSARKWMPTEEYQKFKAETSYELIPEKTRKTLLRFYNDKVNFLIVRSNLEESVGCVLKSMHRYRNEVYHRSLVRKATIKPAVIILYEIVCYLLETLKPRQISYSSEDDWSEFYKQYDIDSYMELMNGGLEKIVSRLRDSMAISTVYIAKLLSEHLQNRINDMEESLEFIFKNTTGAVDIEDELKRIQYWRKYEKLPINKEDQEELDNFTPEYSNESFSGWRKSTDKLLEENNKLEVFNKFYKIETELEPLEEMISEVAGLIDQAIQTEVDRIRGK
jgi:hypothetical protein